LYPLAMIESTGVYFRREKLINSQSHKTSVWCSQYGDCMLLATLMHNT
jgi:hypothetical protein